MFIIALFIIPKKLETNYMPSIYEHKRLLIHIAKLLSLPVLQKCNSYF